MRWVASSRCTLSPSKTVWWLTRERRWKCLRYVAQGRNVTDSHMRSVVVVWFGAALHVLDISRVDFVR
jgi:hypothetical protein